MDTEWVESYNVDPDMNSESNQQETVAILVATFKRLDCLRRLHESISNATSLSWRIFVADNACEESVKQFVESPEVGGTYIPLPGNPGCARGLFACELAVEASGPFDWVAIVDDDCELIPGCLDSLIHELRTQSTSIVVPMIEDADGRVTSFAGPLPEPAWTTIKSNPEADRFAEIYAGAAFPMRWFPGVCFALPYRKLSECGRHEAAFWMMGEDLDFSLRYTQDRPGKLVVDARARHLPPQSSGHKHASDFAYAKETAMIMNSIYLISKTTHGRALLRFLPGNVYRWIARFLGNRPVFRDLAWCLWSAGICGLRAGSREYQHRFLNLDRDTAA